MNKTSTKNHYEILDVQPGATQEEIEAAYRRAQATYGDDSVALYSLYSKDEKEAILRDIRKAYETLKDSSKRAYYNTTISESGDSEGSGESGSKGPRPAAASNLSDFTPTGPSLRVMSRLLADEDSDPVAAEQYRVLYTKLEHLSVRNSYKTFAISSAVKGEGKTITSLNLAYTIANDFKKKVALVECDLKKPSLLTYFSSPGGVNDIVNVVGRGAELDRALHRVDDTSLYLLPAGKSVRNSSEILGSQRMKEVLSELKLEFDYVIVDSPPILHLADMNIISRLVDGLILVVRAGKTPKDLVEKAAKSLHNANILGVVLNGSDISLNRYYYR